MEPQVHTTPPEGFIPHVEVAACYLEYNGTLLLLQISPEKPEVGKWTVPSGKIESRETPHVAALRELFEETGISLSTPLSPLPPLYVRKPDVDYIYHPFKVQLTALPQVQLSTEHQNYKWASAQELQTLPLIAGGKQALHPYFYSEEGFEP